MSEPKKKKGFKMPHMLWLMIILLLICSLATYVIPAGAFGTDPETGAILGDQFSYLGQQTPVNPIKALLQIFPGLTGSATIAFIVMVGGATIQIFLDTKTFDKLLDWAIVKLQGQGDTLLISILFCLMVYLGGFGGSDALIAIVPVGVAFAKKMKMDGFVAMMVTTFATLIGFGTGPNKMFTVQVLMETRAYAGFGTRFIIMNIMMIVGLLMTLQYAKKIKADPTKSPLYGESFKPEEFVDDGEVMTTDVVIDWRMIVTLILFVGQYLYIVWYGMKGTAIFGYDLFTMQCFAFMVIATIIGLVNGMSWDQMGASFTKGLAGMAFVGFVIGMARSVSLVLGMGNVLHTIVYVITRPLMNLPRWISSVGMMLVIALINPIIPSASSKAAILVPIIKPIGEVLQMHPELIVQAYQFGDGFTNIISPVLGWTVGSLAMCGIDYPKWFKWAFPRVLVMLLVAAVIMIVLTMMGYTGAF
ncbi:MAG: YfcC family protein [Solobacterium sp.]|nr:YfcC family protein [Solobacterium sp.]